MQLKNALIGALVGGVIGIGALVAAFQLLGAQQTALALLVAVLVGCGVRLMVSTKGHASYLRGALTALVAIAAYVGGNFVVAKIAQTQMAANAAQPMRVAAAPEQQAPEDTVATEGAAEAPAVEIERTREMPRVGAPMRAPLRPGFSTPDFLWLTVAALVAMSWVAAAARVR
jgi:hypothetical protein